MRSTLLLLGLLFSIVAHAQLSPKTVKKAIPVKGIKSVKQTSFSDQLFHYYAKKDTGIWDAAANKILINHMKSANVTSMNGDWLIYQTASGYGVIELKENTALVESRNPIHLAVSKDKNLVNVINLDYVGFLDMKRNAAHVISTGHRQDATFFDDGFDGHKCFYENEARTVTYGYGEIDGFEDYSHIKQVGGFVLEGGRLFDISTGEMVKDCKCNAREWRSYIVTHTGGMTSYYNDELQPVFEGLERHDYKLNHFQTFVDKNITEVEYTGEKGVYAVKSGSKTTFYSVRDMQPLSGQFNFVFPIGQDFVHGGKSWFTYERGEGYGLFNTQRGEEIPAKHMIIQKRAFPDGTYWYRFGNKLRLATNNLNDAPTEKTWDPALEKTTTIIYHLGTKNGRLILSKRSTGADTHDSEFYTATRFQEGSGVIILKDNTYQVIPGYHTITPFKGHYVAMRPDYFDNAGNLETVLFDGEFMPAIDKPFGVSFIYNDMLIVRDPKTRYYSIYDIERKRIKRRLGKARDMCGDFQLFDGYLLIGDNNYEDFGSHDFAGMDIADIINTKGRLINVPARRFRYVEMLGNDLVIIGRVPREEPTDISLHRMKMDAYAIFDLKSERIITPWVHRIEKEPFEDGILYQPKEDQNMEPIPMKEIRARFRRR